MTWALSHCHSFITATRINASALQPSRPLAKHGTNTFTFLKVSKVKETILVTESIHTFIYLKTLMILHVHQIRII